MNIWFWRYVLSLVPTVFGGLSLLLVLANGVLSLANRTTQAEVNARAQYITQTVQLDRVSQAIVRAAATAAVNNDDKRLGDLLTANGIRYQVNPPVGTSPAGPAPAIRPAGAPPPAARANAPAGGTAPAQTAKGGR